MTTPLAPRPFGSTSLRVGPIGLGSSYGLAARDVERASERGVNFFLWGSRRRGDFGLGLRNVVRARRASAIVAIQSYTRVGWMMRFGVERALRTLGTDYIDVLCLAWWNGAPPPRIVDAALRLRESGKVQHLMLSSHHRPLFAELSREARDAQQPRPTYDAFMLRYNAAHPGAEREIFPHLPERTQAEGRRPATVAFTATRWGSLLDPRVLPAGEATPRASDCYRFALSDPNVDLCLAGPKDSRELDEALLAVDRGAMNGEELAWMRRVGAHVRQATKSAPRGVGMALADRMAQAFTCSSSPKQLAG